MGCQGSEIQILSCRPKFPKKPTHCGWFFYVYDLAMVKRWQNDGKTPDNDPGEIPILASLGFINVRHEIK